MHYIMQYSNYYVCAQVQLAAEMSILAALGGAIPLKKLIYSLKTNTVESLLKDALEIRCPV